MYFLILGQSCRRCPQHQKSRGFSAEDPVDQISETPQLPSTFHPQRYLRSRIRNSLHPQRLCCPNFPSSSSAPRTVLDGRRNPSKNLRMGKHRLPR